MWYPFKNKRTLGKRFVTGVAPSLQNWWTVERSLVGSTPIRFRQKESQKAPQSLKSLAGLFIQVSYSPRVSLGIWIYRYFVGISDGIFICWVPFAIRNTGSRWDGLPAWSACRAGVSVAHPWDSMRYDAAAVSNEALLPLNSPGTAAPGGRPCLWGCCGWQFRCAHHDDRPNVNCREQKRGSPQPWGRGLCCVGGRKILELPFHSEVSVNGCCITAEKFAPGV